MQNDHEFFNLADATQGIPRQLAPGISTRIFTGDKAMISIVTLEPNVEGLIHSHPEEQWGLLLEGDAVRIQGGREVAVGVGDFWRTPGGVPHGMRAGAAGARVLDVFSPPREAYKKTGKGFSTK